MVTISTIHRESWYWYGAELGREFAYSLSNVVNQAPLLCATIYYELWHLIVNMLNCAAVQYTRRGGYIKWATMGYNRKQFFVGLKGFRNLRPSLIRLKCTKRKMIANDFNNFIYHVHLLLYVSHMCACAQNKYRLIRLRTHACTQTHTNIEHYYFSSNNTTQRAHNTSTIEKGNK